MMGKERQRRMLLAGLAGVAAAGPVRAMSRAGGTSPRQPLIIAHRGASGHRPEHSRAAYDLAIDMGADYIEPDLVATRDRHLVVRHGHMLGDSTDVAIRFPQRIATRTTEKQAETGFFTEDFTLSELKTLRLRVSDVTGWRNKAWDGLYDLLTFQEVIDIARAGSRRVGRTIGIAPELKHPRYYRSIGIDTERLLLETLDRNGLTGRSAPVIVQSFEFDTLDRLRTQTAVTLTCLTGNPQDVPPDFAARGDPRTYGDMLTPRGLAAIAKRADMLSPRKQSLLTAVADGACRSTGLTAMAHDAGLKVVPFVFGDEPASMAACFEGDPHRELAAFFADGIDGLFNDFPDTAVRVRSGM